MQQPPLRDNGQVDFDVVDPAFYMFDPQTAREMTEFLRNDPAVGGWKGQPVRFFNRQLDFSSLANGSSATDTLKINGGLNAVIITFAASATTSTGSPRTSLNTDLIDIKQLDAARFEEIQQAPLSNVSGSGALPSRFPPQKWIGNVDRLVTMTNYTGSTADIRLTWGLFGIYTGR